MQENTMQENQNQILEGYSNREKGAYLGAIASLATADRAASADELEHLEELADAADLSQDQTAAVMRAATELDGKSLTECLDILKKSELRFSLVADLIAFAEIDNNYSPEERANIDSITSYLGVNKTQFGVLDQFVQRTTQSHKTPEEITRPGFLESLGLKEQFSKAGISLNSSTRGLLGMLGPILLGGLLGRSMRKGSARPRSSTGFPGGFGGLGSIFSALNGRPSAPQFGGLLKRLLR
jgi:tellurite resistance protein